MVRSEQFTDLLIDSVITLRSGSDRLEISTTVDNQARDHRLRVLFPSGAAAGTYLADSAFDVVERPINLPQDNHQRRELAVETCPQQTWTAVADSTRGLAVVAPGLMETAVRDLPDRPLALTLFRSTRRTVFTDGETTGQLPGEMTFRYWLSPVHGEIDRVGLAEAGIQLGAGLRTTQLPAAGLGGIFIPVPTKLPREASFLATRGGIIVTSVREKAGALEVRFFNPHTTEVSATFDFSGRPAGAAVPNWAERVNFEGAVAGPRELISGTVFRTTVRPKEIVTVRFPATPAS
jgi:alpha-mannosidase/mannosylglycerate hydrolase